MLNLKVLNCLVEPQGQIFLGRGNIMIQSSHRSGDHRIILSIKMALWLANIYLPNTAGLISVLLRIRTLKLKYSVGKFQSLLQVNLFKRWTNENRLRKLLVFFLTNQFGYHVTNSLTPGYSYFYPLSQHSSPLYVSFKWNGKSSQSRAVVEVHYRSIHPRVVLLRPPSSVVFTNYPTEVSWFLNISKMLLPRAFFFSFFSKHFVKREPYTKWDRLRREGKIVVFSTRLYISRSDDSSVSSVLNIKTLFIGEIQFSDMCHQGNMNCMFSWCISYCKTRDEQLDFLYPNKDDVTRYLKLHNLEQFFQFFTTVAIKAKKELENYKKQVWISAQFYFTFAF